VPDVAKALGVRYVLKAAYARRATGSGWPHSDSDASEGALTAKTRTHLERRPPPCQDRSAASGQKTQHVES
jgi:hypothetical protein